MGYLDNSSVTVDMILTKKGRQLLAKGKDFFRVSQFALADDEIDYRNWNPNHPLGTNYYGEIIDNMPILEAVPDETQIMRYKLVTYAKNRLKIPQVSLDQGSSVELYEGQSITLSPTIIGSDSEANGTLGYTFTTSDSTVLDLGIPAGSQVNVSGLPTVALSTLGTVEKVSHSVIAKRALLIPKQVTQDTNVVVNVFGNETGGSYSLNVTVKRLSQDATSNFI